MDRAHLWSTQQLVEFLAAVGSYGDEPSALAGALERAAEALEAELALLLRGDVPVAALGFCGDGPPDPALVAAVVAGATEVDVAGLGRATVCGAPLQDGTAYRLVLVRLGDEVFAKEEVSLLGAMARVLSLSLKSLRLLETERALREQSDRQAREARHDPLTGLPNRGLFLERLGTMLSAAGPDVRVGLLFLDMDGFKDVNDSLGHAAGDRLLVEVAERLRRIVGAPDLVSRLGGDEFAIAFERCASPSDAICVAERILGALHQPFLVGMREVLVSGSIGFTIAEPGETDPESLLRDADVAMYRAKASGRDRHAAFEQSMLAELHDRVELERDLRRAIDAGELVLHFQPIVALASGTLTGIEALVRWRCPKRGLVSPLQFIPTAEETGLIVPLGQWVLTEACRRLVELGRVLPAAGACKVAVNVSPRQFLEPDLTASVASVLASTGLEPAQLVLEITEGVLLDGSARSSSTLGELRALGVRLAIDDFGTGYSSLAYLQRLPVDVLKVDKSFVDAIDSGGDLLVRAIVNLGSSLGLEVTAEGVETSSQAALLQAVGCDMAQGYLYSPPLAFDDLLSFVVRSSLAPSVALGSGFVSGS